MEQWQDQGIILSARRHGESGAIVTLLAKEHGKHAGYVRGAHSTKMRGALEIGNIVDVNWTARISDNLGSYALELSDAPASRFFYDPLKLLAVQAACELCAIALPERSRQNTVFDGLNALFQALDSEIWQAAFVYWEIALLRELGFALDLSICAGGGDKQNLVYVSPKTGRAVSAEMGEPYKDKLLPLASFLRPNGTNTDLDQIILGLEMTGYFFEHWALAHHNGDIPEARLRLQQRLKNHYQNP